MNPEKKNINQGNELSEDELDGVTGGAGFLNQSFMGVKNDKGLNSAFRASAISNGANAFQVGSANNAVNPSNRENLSKL